MKRKVNRVGQNTLTVSLPSKWVKEQGIEYGDELSLEEVDEKVIISKNEIAMKKKEITLNIDNMNYFILSRYGNLLYRNNYSKITFLYTKKELYDNRHKIYFPVNHIINRIIGRLIGGEIISQTSNKTIIECFTSDEKQDLEKVEKRIYFLIREMMEQLYQHIDNDFSAFNSVSYDYHDNICKFTNYFLREINFSNLSTDYKRETFSLYIIVDKIGDKLRHLGEKINNYGCTPRVKKYIDKIFDLLYSHFELLYNIKNISDVVNKRYEIFHSIHEDKFTSDEMQIIVELDILINVITNFSEYAIIKEIYKNEKTINF